MLGGREYTVIACAAIASLTIVTCLALIRNPDSGENTASAYKDVAIALLQITGGAIGGAAGNEYLRNRRDNGNENQPPSPPAPPSPPNSDAPLFDHLNDPE